MNNLEEKILYLFVKKKVTTGMSLDKKNFEREYLLNDYTVEKIDSAFKNLVQKKYLIGNVEHSLSLNRDKYGELFKKFRLKLWRDKKIEKIKKLWEFLWKHFVVTILTTITTVLITMYITDF